MAVFETADAYATKEEARAKRIRMQHGDGRH